MNKIGRRRLAKMGKTIAVTDAGVRDHRVPEELRQEIMARLQLDDVRGSVSDRFVAWLPAGQVTITQWRDDPRYTTLFGATQLWETRFVGRRAKRPA